MDIIMLILLVGMCVIIIGIAIMAADERPRPLTIDELSMAFRKGPDLDVYAVRREENEHEDSAEEEGSQETQDGGQVQEEDQSHQE